MIVRVSVVLKRCYKSGPLKAIGQVQRTRLITSSTDKHYSLDSEDDPLKLSKRQSSTTVLFRTTLTQTITQYHLMIPLGSNHLPIISLVVQSLRDLGISFLYLAPILEKGIDFLCISNLEAFI